MTSSEAEYYQEHKDDSDEWGEPERPERAPSRRLASMISVRFSPEEADLVRAEAARRGQSVSMFIRESTLSRCGRDREPLPRTIVTARFVAAASTTTQDRPLRGTETRPDDATFVDTVGELLLA